MHVNINRILILAMLLMPMQHIFAHSSTPSHNKTNNISGSHHFNQSVINHNSDNSKSCDSFSTSSDCKTHHSNSCGNNCSSMGHCCIAVVSTHNFSPTQVFEKTVDLSRILMDITTPVETHPPQTL